MQIVVYETNFWIQIFGASGRVVASNNKTLLTFRIISARRKSSVRQLVSGSCCCQTPLEYATSRIFRKIWKTFEACRR